MIDISELSQLCEQLGCRITPECSLREYITFRFGGVCRALISVNSPASVCRLISYMKENDVKYGILGRGSNVIVSDEGFDDTYGARPLRRAIQSEIEDTLSERMLDGQIAENSSVVCDYSEGKFIFTAE